MKTITLFVLLTLGSLAVNACEYSLLSSYIPFKEGIHTKRFPLNSRSPFSHDGLRREGMFLMKENLPARAISCSAVYHDFRRYSTTFDRGAIFCRMENQVLRKYNVKFSIHAGGYRE
ncbi:MAG TPA: hypothetical protein VK826_09725 [Bacteroidia bacterium]|nr:hypothetical protein [Bacteroidia bacterium]